MQYEIKEMPDLQKTGKRKVIAKAVNHRQIDFETFLNMWAKDSSFDKGLLRSVLDEFRQQLQFYMALGHSVKVDGLFVSSIALSNKNGAEELKEEGVRYDTNGVYIKGVNFLTDAKWLNSMRREVHLEKVGKVRKLRNVTTTEEERLQMALEYMREHHGMIRIPRYVALTGISHTNACKELRKFSRMPESGMMSMGRGSSLVYVLRDEENK
ncbi:MAG: hypothetical protein KBT29_00470 [Prevotellaceae bacterium]|nr:hypothetical protein [Candidatus Minthosoma caballi]